MITQFDVKTELEAMVKLAKENFDELGFAEPKLTVLVNHSKEKCNEIHRGQLPFPVSIGREAQRMLLERIGEFMAREFGVSDVEAIGCISEAWAITEPIENKDEAMKLSPREHPNRKEVVIISIQTRAGEGLTRVFDIILEGSKRVLQEMSEDSKKPLESKSALLQGFWRGYYGLSKNQAQRDDDDNPFPINYGE